MDNIDHKKTELLHRLKNEAGGITSYSIWSDEDLRNYAISLTQSKFSKLSSVFKTILMGYAQQINAIVNMKSGERPQCQICSLEFSKIFAPKWVIALQAYCDEPSVVMITMICYQCGDCDIDLLGEKIRLAYTEQFGDIRKLEITFPDVSTIN